MLKYQKGIKLFGAYVPLTGGTLTGNLLATDDTYYLGDSTHGWKGLHLPSTFIRDQSGQVDLRNSADSAWVGLGCGAISPTSDLLFQADGAIIQARNLDSYTLIGKARDNGVGLAEIWRMVGAADPYFRIGRDDTGVGLSSITDGLVLQMGGGTGNEAAGFGFGMKWMLGNASSEVEERGRINLRLVTATNGSEDTGWDIYTQLAGASNLAFKVDQAGELYGDADSTSGAYMTQNANLFDEYDDVAELRRFQLTVPRTGLISEEQRLANQERLVELGVWERKPEGSAGSSYLMKMQTMTRLLAGGIFQTRQALEGLRDEVLDRLERLEGARA